MSDDNVNLDKPLDVQPVDGDTSTEPNRDSHEDLVARVEALETALRGANLQGIGGVDLP